MRAEFPDSKFFPSPEFFITIEGEVNGEKKSKDVFALSHADILALMRYVWMGCCLPTTRDAYIRQLDIHPEGVETVSTEIDILVAAYQKIYQDNTKFRDVTWNSVRDLAEKVRHYAKVAGGNYDSSYYAVLIQAVTDYNTERDKGEAAQDKQKMEEARKEIIEFAKDLDARIQALQAETQKVQHDIDEFRKLADEHDRSMKDSMEKVKELLSGEQGEIQLLTIEVAALQIQLAVETAEYDYDVKVAASTPAYAWCTLFGFIAAVSVASIYGKRATDMLAKMKETQTLIDTDMQKLKAARIVVADCQRMNLSTGNVVKHAEGAIDVLKKMEAGWEDIKGVLDGLHVDATDNPDDIPSIIMNEHRVRTMIHAWNELGDDIDEFVKNSYIAEPDYLTLSEFMEKYGK